jgi:glycosyltransferase involved in cell wall biosynthesis
VYDKPRIVQHVAGFNKIGGPTTELRSIISSRLAKDFQFERISQERPARGINIRLVLEMAHAIKRVHPDIVHIRGLQNEGFHGVLAAYLAGCRNVLVAVHGFAEDAHVRGPIRNWILSHIMEPLTLLLARRVYCVCSAASDRPMIRSYAKKKCSVIQNGINISSPAMRDISLRQQLGATINDRVALYVGRISRDKGLYVLADALRQMQNPPIIWIAGDGPDSESLRAAFGSLVDAGCVKMLGRREDVPALLGACDFFVFPTLHENLSMALLEAMHAERAVLATSVGGNPEVVLNGVTGVLIPPGDSVALAHNLALFSERPELCADMGRKGRERVEQFFSLERMIDQLETIYHSMLIKEKNLDSRI